MCRIGVGRPFLTRSGPRPIVLAVVHNYAAAAVIALVVLSSRKTGAGNQKSKLPSTVIFDLGA
jgi:hypothetical protein